MLFDGHNDTLKRAYLTGTSFFERNTYTGIDLPRARAAGYRGGFFAIMTPPETAEERNPRYGLTLSEKGWDVVYPRSIGQAYAEGFTTRLLDAFLAEVEARGGIAIVRDSAQLRHALDGGEIAVILHLEGAEAICEDLSNLPALLDRGVRSIGPVWSRPNCFGSGVPFRFPSTPDIGPGLTPAGKRLITACNDLRILVDLTHLNEHGFWDVAELTVAPLVVSHANVHRICPSTTNLMDTQLDAIARSGGIVGVMFDVLNTRPDGKLVYETSIELILRHVDYIVDRVGIDHVGFGSDMDGAQMPTALASVESWGSLLELLTYRGYSQENVEKIAWKNWARVICETWG